MKPDWKDAPEFAKYLAMDSDGDWYWYENEPTFSNGRWNCNGGEFISCDDHASSLTLEPRP